MTTTISAQDAITAVHEAAMLLPDTGMTFAAIAGATGLTDRHLTLVLNLHERRGTMSRIDGRWVAWDICPTCGGGTDDRLPPTANHPEPGVCHTAPTDRHAGYPTNQN